MWSRREVRSDPRLCVEVDWLRGSCVSSSCRGSVGFLTRYDEELMEPLVQCQVKQRQDEHLTGPVSRAARSQDRLRQARSSLFLEGLAAVRNIDWSRAASLSLAFLIT